MLVRSTFAVWILYQFTGQTCERLQKVQLNVSNWYRSFFVNDDFFVTLRMNTSNTMRIILCDEGSSILPFCNLVNNKMERKSKKTEGKKIFLVSTTILKKEKKKERKCFSMQITRVSRSKLSRILRHSAESINIITSRKLFLTFVILRLNWSNRLVMN